MSPGRGTTWAASWSDDGEHAIARRCAWQYRVSTARISARKGARSAPIKRPANRIQTARRPFESASSIGCSNACWTRRSVPQLRRGGDDGAVVARTRQSNVELLVAGLVVKVLEFAKDHHGGFKAFERADR